MLPDTLNKLISAKHIYKTAKEKYFNLNLLKGISIVKSNFCIAR